MFLRRERDSGRWYHACIDSQMDEDGRLRVRCPGSPCSLAIGAEGIRTRRACTQAIPARCCFGLGHSRPRYWALAEGKWARYHRRICKKDSACILNRQRTEVNQPLSYICFSLSHRRRSSSSCVTTRRTSSSAAGIAFFTHSGSGQVILETSP